MDARLRSLLGLAMRAGSVACGVEGTRRAIREGEARLVLLSEDGAAGQLEKVRRTLAGGDVPHAVAGTRRELGMAVGESELTAVAITNASLASEIRGGVGIDIGTVQRQQ